MDLGGDGDIVTSLTRRGFLRRAGLAGAAAAAGAAAPGLLAACSAKPDMGPPLEGELHVPPPGTGGGPALVYRGWNYKVDIVQQYLSRFTDHYREKVDYQTVTGDYGSIITKMAINREPLNFQYANPDTAARWYIADWLYDYSH